MIRLSRRFLLIVVRKVDFFGPDLWARCRPTCAPPLHSPADAQCWRAGDDAWACNRCARAVPMLTGWLGAESHKGESIESGHGMPIAVFRIAAEMHRPEASSGL